MKSTSLVKTKEFEVAEIDESNIEDVEKRIIEESKSNIQIDNEKELVENLMQVLNIERQEGEKVAEFETRVKQEVDKILDI